MAYFRYEPCEVLNPQHNSSTFLNKQNEAITPSIIQQNQYEKDAFEVDLFPIHTIDYFYQQFPL